VRALNCPISSFLEVIYRERKLTDVETLRRFLTAEYYDHLIRDGADFRHSVRYVLIIQSRPVIRLGVVGFGEWLHAHLARG